MLELMARSGMRVGEVLKLRSMDIEDRKAIIRDPKSGREAEVVFLPQKVADRLRNYINENEIKPDAKIFPLTYAAARLIVIKAGNLVGINVRPQDLRRTRCHVRVSRREHLLKSCQRYCCGIQPSDHPALLGENQRCRAMRWIDNLHG